MNVLIILCLLSPSIYGLNLTPVVNSTSGPIQGKISHYESIGVYQFLGIPYAKPPVGKLRFQLPVKPDSWTEVKPVTDFGSACLQLNNFLLRSSEDCLYLNVYVTESTFNNSSNKQRPVLFWIHGGSFATGSGNLNTEGIPMVPLHDVVLVTINYRLNAFGFIYFGADEPRIPANIGLQDQLFALKWVHENIKKFGGDPNSVTIFGESAGSISVSAHLLSPLSKGLFKRAILQSGSVYVNSLGNNTVIANSWKIYNNTSCSKSKDVLGCMQNLQPSDIQSIINDQQNGLGFSLYVGDNFLPYEISKTFTEGLFDNSIDLLLGVEKNEASLLMLALDPKAFNLIAPQPISYQQATTLLKQIFDDESFDYFRELYFGPETNNSEYLKIQLEKALSDILMVCPTYAFGQQYAFSLGSQGGNVYAYYHTQKSPLPVPEWIGTYHTADIPYVFGSIVINPGNSPKDISLSHEMMKIWTYFAENGETPMIGETKWQPFKENISAMILNIDDWGKIETNRVQLCIKEWPNFIQHIRKK